MSTLLAWMSATKSPYLTPLVLRLGSALFALLLVLYVGRLGVQHIDMGVVADGGWRIYLGQVPYRDFKVPWLPVTFYLQSLFFWASGGFQWMSLVWHAALLNGLGALLTYSIARKRLGHWAAAACGVFSGLTLYGPLSFPWFDTTAFLFVLLAVWLVELRPLSRRITRSLDICLAGVSLALASLSKVNIGIGALLAIALILTVDASFSQRGQVNSRRVLQGPAILSVGFVVAACVAVVWLESQSPFLQSVASLVPLTGRLSRVLDTEWWLGSFGSLRYGVHAGSLAVLAALGLWIIGDHRRIWEHRRDVGPMLVRVISIASLHVFAAVTGQLHSSIYQPLFGVLVAYLLGLFAIMAGDGFYGQPVPLRLARWAAEHGHWLAAGFVGLVVLGLFRPSAPGHRAVLGRYSQNYVSILLTLATLAALSWWLTSHRVTVARGVERFFTQSRGWLVAAAFAGLAAGFLVDDVKRTAWEYYFPRDVYLANLVPVEVEGFEGIQMDRPMGGSLTALVAYASQAIPKSDAIFVWPNYRWVQGVLGREPIRGTLLLHQPPITHRVGSDPETDAVVAANPAWIILSGAAWAHTVADMRLDSPRLARWIKENFELAAVIPGFSVLRKSR